MKKIFFAAVIFAACQNVFSQNVGINSTGAAPNASAGLDVNYTNLGILIPRVTLTQTSLASPVASPATSLTVYNTAAVNDVTPGFYFWDGTKWVRLINTGNNAGTEWLLAGNALTGTLPASPNEFIGTTNAADWIIKTNNISRMTVASTGIVGVNTAPAGAYLKISSSNSSYDGIDAFHTSGTAGSAFNAVEGNVNNAAYTQATGYLAYHNTSNKTFSVYGNGGDLAGMFNGKVGVNSVSTVLTNSDVEVRNNTAGANPANVFLRQTTSNTLLNSVLGNLDFGDDYNTSAQARIQVMRDAASASGADLPTAFTFWNMADGANTLTERMRIANNGNVGINSTNPIYNLDITSSSVNGGLRVYGPSANMIVLRDNDDLGGPHIAIWPNISGVGTLRFQKSSISQWNIYDRSTANTNAGRIFSINDGFGVGDIMTFWGNGNVGIGNTTPAMKLDVTTSSTTVSDAAIRGVSTGTGVTLYGVEGTAAATANLSAGVYGLASGTGQVFGVLGQISNSTATNAAGVRGQSQQASGVSFGVWGESASATANAAGVYGTSSGTNGNGMFGQCNVGATATGVMGKSSTGYAGFFAGSGTSWGVYGSAGAGNYAGWFSGDVNIVGTLSKSAGAFKIDHPLDPANKYLVHSFVESPDMMNVYNGNIITDNNGEAAVQLPSYFQAENMDFKYQLTVIGQFAQAIILKEVSENQFVIKTDKPNVKVSWQVTGVRNDLYAQKHRLINEVEKTGEEKGKYLHPELYGAGEELSVDRAKGPIQEKLITDKISDR